MILIGQKYNNLTVKEILTGGMAVFQCDCGVICQKRRKDVVSGNTKSCGCRKIKSIVERLTTHGLSRHPLKAVWLQMISRCYNEGHKRYKDYGARGITVCDEWRNSFLTFYNWCLENGYNKGLQLDRENNDSGYSPDNCRFVTRLVNVRNTRSNRVIFYKGKSQTLSMWCEELNLSYPAMLTRIIRHNPTPEELFETPSRYAKHKIRIADGKE